MMAHMGVMRPVTPPSLLRGLKRGLAQRCPNCGEGKLFRQYLKVEPVCAACGHENGHYPADDGPAYFTILIVGHLVVAPLMLFPFIWETHALIVVPATLIPLLGLTMLLLPRIKGAFIGWLWHLGLKQVEDPAHEQPEPIA